jgi:hypothetical protein
LIDRILHYELINKVKPREKMKEFKPIRLDEKAMELPINIVVMLFVVIVALATLISIVPTPTKEMSVFVEMAALRGGHFRKVTQ